MCVCKCVCLCVCVEWLIDVVGGRCCVPRGHLYNKQTHTHTHTHTNTHTTYIHTPTPRTATHPARLPGGAGCPLPGEPVQGGARAASHPRCRGRRPFGRPCQGVFVSVCVCVSVCVLLCVCLHVCACLCVFISCYPNKQKKNKQIQAAMKSALAMGPAAALPTLKQLAA